MCCDFKPVPTDGFALRDGARCNSDGHSAITSAAECHLAATELGLGDVMPVSTVDHHPDKARAQPPGCYWKATNDKGWRLWFNANREPPVETALHDHREQGSDGADFPPSDFAGGGAPLPTLPLRNALCRAGKERNVLQPRKGTGDGAAAPAADKVSDYDKYHTFDALMRGPIKAHRVHAELTMETVLRFNATLAQQLQDLMHRHGCKDLDVAVHLVHTWNLHR